MNEQRAILKVVGENKMHCDGCESTVRFAVQQLPGVTDVSASHASQEILVTYAPDAVDLVRIRQELDWIGYQVEEA